jgi:hypothetical protein
MNLEHHKNFDYDLFKIDLDIRLRHEITYWNFAYLFQCYYSMEFEVLTDYYYYCYHYELFGKLIFHHIYRKQMKSRISFE